MRYQHLYKKYFKVLTIIFLLVMEVILVNGKPLIAQKGRELIRVEASRRMHFFKGDTELNKRELVYHMERYPEAYKVMSSAKGHYDMANACLIGGGAFILIPIASSLRDGNPAWWLAGLGSAMCLLSIPLYSSYETKALEAVHLWNEHISGRRLYSKVLLDVKPFFMSAQNQHRSAGLAFTLQF